MSLAPVLPADRTVLMATFTLNFVIRFVRIYLRKLMTFRTDPPLEKVEIIRFVAAS